MAPSAVSLNIGARARNGGVESGSSLVNGQLKHAHASIHNSNSHFSSSEDEPLDLLCIGFGPASLAVAIAIHDEHLKTPDSTPPKVLFLEKQSQFAWHAGMQLPGAKMQISFLKDLATPRDPKSKFTFLNYLFEKGRLNHFINLGTFLPTRAEYEDYLRWCARHFEREGVIGYGMEVKNVRPGAKNKEGEITTFFVTSKDQYGGLSTSHARHVVIAVGGRPVIPQSLHGLKNIAHSSQFAMTVSKIEQQKDQRPLRFAVLGSGQSAAEIFNDLWDRFPDSQVKLVIKGASLRPSDDSPFVNEIFDPDRVDGIYNQKSSDRARDLALDRGTNYGVVRLELLEHLYERLYMQRLQNSDESQWRCRIIPNRVVLFAKQSSDSTVSLKLGEPECKRMGIGEEIEEDIEVDHVFAATGYKRDAHEDILSELRDLLPDFDGSQKFWVARDYRLQFNETKVAQEAGIWLQGCNEETHGLSDTLLSILAVRGGELVNSIFNSSSA